VHAYGGAIDVNPVENPYVESGRVHPRAGRAYLDRSRRRPGSSCLQEPQIPRIALIESAASTPGARSRPQCGRPRRAAGSRTGRISQRHPGRKSNLWNL